MVLPQDLPHNSRTRTYLLKKVTVLKSEMMIAMFRSMSPRSRVTHHLGKERLFIAKAMLTLVQTLLLSTITSKVEPKLQLVWQDRPQGE